MNIVRIGASYTHKLDAESVPVASIPVSVTIAGAVARSVNAQSDLSAIVAGVGQSTASVKDSTWGELGARIEGQITDSVSLSLDVNGTTGGPTDDTDLHGGVGLGFAF